jgi:hypothetical protein
MFNRRNYSSCSVKIDNGQNNSVMNNEEGETGQRNSNLRGGRSSNMNNNSNNFTFQMNDVGSGFNFSTNGNSNFTYQFSSSSSSSSNGNRRATVNNPNNEIFNVFNFLGNNMNNMFSNNSYGVPNDLGNQMNNIFSNASNITSNSYNINEQNNNNEQDDTEEEMIQRYHRVRKYAISRLPKYKYNAYVKTKPRNKQE